MSEENKKEEKPESQEEDPATPNPPEKDLFGQGKIVLIIDDEPTSLQLQEHTLKDVGFEVITATNGKDAWLKITPQVKPNLIISDVIMPDMDGYQFLKELKDNKEVSNTPILIVSARKNMKESFLVIGSDGFIPKPFDIEEFLKEVKKLSSLEKPKKAPETPAAKEEKKK